MTYFYLIVAAVLIYIIIRFVLPAPEETVKVAFAGVNYGGSAIRKRPQGNNKTVYTEGENTIDLSSYEKFVIEGNSLEEAGLREGTVVYVLPWKNSSVYLLLQRFVVLRFDNERTAVEHPDKCSFIDGYKVRKIVALFPTGLSQRDFEERMLSLVEKDSDIQDKVSAVHKLWKKYQFASNYYKEDGQLTVSLTYKNGVEKDYSFHSTRFVHGIVGYKEV